MLRRVQMLLSVHVMWQQCFIKVFMHVVNTCDIIAVKIFKQTMFVLLKAVHFITEFGGQLHFFPVLTGDSLPLIINTDYFSRY